MDLLYGVWSDRTKAAVDAVTICFLIFYLIVLLGGGISSTQYALQYNEVSPTLWRPQMAPIKIIMCIGIFLMLLQAIATLIKDVAKLKGEQWGYPETPSSDAATAANGGTRSEEHTSELQSLMRISSAVFCLTKKKKNQ